MASVFVVKVEINVWVQRVLGHLHTTSRYHQVGGVLWSVRGVYDGVGGARHLQLLLPCPFLTYLLHHSQYLSSAAAAAAAAAD
ncbi:hypothetical protein Lal_00000483 [Lupinus albus]|nr:hypothetical protein Lal_00000483 [Lupinus albus]